MRARLALPVVLTLFGCSPPPADEPAAGHLPDGKADSSNQATILDFEFDAELSGASFFGAESAIRDQLLYTIGHLNGNRAVGRLDRLKLTNVVSSNGRVTYHARMPIAWGSKTNLPTTYAFTLPRDVSGFDAFATKYKDSCAESSPHPIDSGSMWYYFRPTRSGCALDDADVVRFTANVTVSATNTDGKYPEYTKVWEDGTLRAVAIFGKYEDGATSGDAGIDAYNSFLASLRALLSGYPVTTTPAMVPTAPGVAIPDVTFRADLGGGRAIEVTALLVDNVRTAGAAFDARYAELSTRADLIAYNGHAGLGQNVRALAQKGRFVTGQYMIMFMNGCDTYAYVDGSMAQTRARINLDDPTGTKYMDIVTNAMPAFFASDAGASMALVRGLLKVDAPATYQTIFANIDRSQVVLVSGEEDNVFTPSGAGAILEQHGTVAQGAQQDFQTAQLPAGVYTARLTPDPAAPGGDDDLYVRVGAAPTSTQYDCRPYIDGSEETCRVTVTAPAQIFLSVRGYSGGAYQLRLTRGE